VIQTVIHYRKSALYIFLRNRTYYFQVRLKKQDALYSHYKSGLIRKSLNTDCYSTAITKSRVILQKLTTMRQKILRMKNNNITEYDSQSQYDADLYSRGRVLNELYEDLDQLDENMINDFFIDEFGSGGKTLNFDKNALEHYSARQKKIKKQEEEQCIKDQYIGLTLQQLKEQYFEFKKASLTTLSSASSQKYDADISLFIKMVGDIDLSLLTYDVTSEKYVNRIKFIPAQMKKQSCFKNANGDFYDIDKIIILTKEKNLKTLSIQTIKQKTTNIVAFLTWVTTKHRIDEHFLKSFKHIQSTKVKDKKKPNFSDHDLKKIFGSDDFTDGLWHHDKTCRHWGSLIALYSGARGNEIAQLKTDDIKQDKDTEVYYFNIKEEFDDDGNVIQRLKNESSIRKCPVHNDLIKLGFLKYVSHRRKQKEKMLLSGVSLYRDKWIRNMNRWFNQTHLDKVNVERFVDQDHAKKSFHSLRHTFINYEKQNRLDGAIISEIVGHSFSGTVHERYQDGFALEAKKKELNKVKFDIDLNAIKVWK